MKGDTLTQTINRADALFAEGEQLFQQNNTSDFYALFEKASQLYLKVENWERYLWCQYRISIWLSVRNRIQEANQIGEKGLKLCYQKLSGPHELKAEFHYRLFYCNFYQHSYVKAEEQAQQTLEIAQELQLTALIVKAYNAIASTYVQRSKHIMGLVFLFKALPYTKFLSHKIENIHLYQTMGHIYFHLKQFYLARVYLERGISMCEKQFGSDYLLIANFVMMLGGIEVEEGDYDEGLKAFTKVIDFKQKYNIEDGELSTAFSVMGEIHIHKGNWQKARQYFERAIRIQKSINENNYNWFVKLYYRYARLHIENERLDEGKLLAKKAKDILPNNADIELAYVYLLEADIALLENELMLVVEYLDEANKCVKEIISIQKVENLSIQFDLYKRQLEVLRRLFTKYHSKDYLISAIQLFPKVYTLIENTRSTVHETLDQLNVNQTAANFYQNATDILYELYLIENNPSYLEEIFVISEKNKVHSLLSTIQNTEALQMTAIPEKELQQLQQLQSAISEYQTLLQQSQAEEIVFDQYAEELVNLQVEYHQLMASIEQNHPEYLHLKHQTHETTLKELQSQVAAQTAAIVYTLTQKNLYILCVLSEEVFLQQIRWTEEDILLIDSFIDEGILGMNRKEYVQKSHQLYQYLIAPVEKYLEKNAIQSLLIFPDNQLLELPFEVLLTQKTSFRTAYGDIPYLLKQYDIRYHYSATLRAYQQSRKTQRKELPPRFLGFAPVYDDAHFSTQETDALPVEATRDVSIRGRNYKALLYSEKEVSDIQASFQKKGWEAQTYLRAKANLPDFKKQVAEMPAKFIHIAAHGVSNQKKNVLGILFSPDKNSLQIAASATTSNIESTSIRQQTAIPSSNGILYAHELYQLKLKSDLVFLSCCESGVGKIAAGEGILSLNRGLLYAGVSNIVFTLFKIYDQTTAIFAHHFYDYLLNKEDNYSKALQYAKLQLIAEGLPPRYWGGFLLLGD
ncbi:MAG: CHAT domain-containing tetratricopeptide repeat protein [Chitinophagales bacterium]